MKLTAPQMQLALVMNRLGAIRIRRWNGSRFPELQEYGPRSLVVLSGLYNKGIADFDEQREDLRSILEIWSLTQTGRDILIARERTSNPHMGLK